MQPQTTEFVAKSVTSVTDLGWVFLVNWSIILFASVLFLFYYHRIFGVLFAWFISPMIWKRHNVRVRIQAFKLSLLSGRLFFKNVTIITKNEMIVIYQGTITWRYWYRNTRINQFDARINQINETINKALPARVLVEIHGMEIFVYNRSDAYEYIQQRLHEEREGIESSSSTKPTIVTESDSADVESDLRQRKTQDLPVQKHNRNANVSPTLQGHMNPNNEAMFNSVLSQLLPLDIKVVKGSLIIGNDTTPYLYIMSYKELKGSMDAAMAPSELDPYRLLYDSKLTNMKVEFKKNISYNKDLVMTEPFKQKVKPSLKRHLKKFGHHAWAPFQTFKGRGTFLDIPDDDEHPHMNEWRGLRRYMQEFQSLNSFEWESLNEKDRNRTEYAKVSTFLTVSSMHLCYYFDIPGKIPQNRVKPSSGPDVGNGGDPPKTGVDIVLTGTQIVYGPWSHKQLMKIYQLLFPTLKLDSKLPEKLLPGNLREYVSFDLQLDLNDDTTIRTPFREQSKESLISESDDLKYGWLDISVNGGSSIETIIFNTPEDKDGFKNTLRANLIKPVANSSVNGSLMFKAEKLVIDADIGFPLEWRGYTHWKFRQLSQSCDIYFLREHVSHLSDLIGDFGSGGDPDEDSFKPFRYTFSFDFKFYSIYTNINEENIIDNPIDHNRNRFITFAGDDLNLDVDLPMLHQFQKSNMASFKVDTSYFILSVDHQEWSTYREFQETNEIGYAADFMIDGSYTYFNVVEDGAIDTISLNCTCSDTTVKVYGFVIKYFIDLKENYFGNNIRFKTYEEYTHSQKLEKVTDTLQTVGTIVRPIDTYSVQGLESIERNRFDSITKSKNETDLQMTFCVDNGCLVFPCNLYDARSHLALHFEQLDIDLRNNNYYMDLQANFSECKGRYIDDCDENVIFTNTKGSLDFKPDIYIDKLSAHGLRIFGLPPVEPTYYCRWTFDTGGIIIDSTPNIIGAFKNALHSFKMGHVDLENSLGVLVLPVMDILNLDFKSPFIKIKINSPAGIANEIKSYFVELDLKKVSFSVSDQPTTKYNSCTEISIEEIKLKAILDSKQIFDLNTNLRFSNLCQKKNGFHRMLQQSLHLHDNDAPFHRTPWLIPEFQRDRTYYNESEKIHNGVYIPRVPIPLNSQTAELFVQSLPAEIRTRLLDSEGNMPNLSSAAEDKSEYAETSFMTMSDEKSYACDFNQKTDSLEYYDSLSNLDPECEHDNITIEMDKILVFMFPGIVVIALDILTHMYDSSLNKVLDELQVEYYLRMRAKIQKSVLNLQLHCDLIDLFFAHEIGDNNGLSLRCHNTDYRMQSLKHGDTEEKFAMKVNFDKLDLNLYENRKTMVSLEMEDLSMEMMKLETLTSRYNLFDFDIDIKLSHINWVIEYVSGFFKHSEIFQIQNAELRDNRKKAKIELLYQLTMITIEHNIVSDPQCLSTIWNQSKKDSVRRDKNWRSLPRLRHVLKSVSTEWKENKNELFKNNMWEAPNDADEKLQSLFSTMRVWEKRQDDIIDMVFGSKEKKKEKMLQFVSLNLHSLKINLIPFDKAIQISDLYFDLSEAKLDPEISNIAFPLLETDIELSTDINFEVKEFMTNFTDIKMNSGEIMQVIHSIFQLCQTFSSNKTYVDEIDSAKSIRNFVIDDYIKPLLITFHINIDYFKHLIEVDRSRLVFQGSKSKAFSSMIKTHKLLSFSLNFMNDYFNISFDTDLFNIMEFQSKNFSTTVINTKPFDNGDLLFAVDIADSEFYLGCDEGKLVELVDIVAFNEYQVFQELMDYFKEEKLQFENDKQTPWSSSSEVNSFSGTEIVSTVNSLGTRFFRENVFTKMGVKATLIFNVGNFIGEINLFHPFVSTFSLNQMNFRVEANEMGMQSIFKINRSNLDLLLFNTKYLTAFIKSFSLNCDVAYLHNIYVFNIQGVLAECRFNMNNNDIIGLISVLHLNISKIRRTVESWTNKLEEVQNHFKSVQFNNETEDDNMSVLFKSFQKHTKFNVFHTLKKWTAWILVNDNIIQLESTDSDLELHTYDEHLKRYLFHGHLFFPSLRMNVNLSGSQGSSFNMLDAKLNVEIKNPTDQIYSRQQLHFKSDHLKFVVKNQIIYEFIQAYGEISRVIDDTSPQKGSDTDDVNNLEKLELISRFFAVVIEADNFCFGWILDNTNFHNHNHNYHLYGPIIGFEHSTIVANEGSGNVSMKGLYLSVAHGQTPDSFYPKGSEFHSNNRIYIPKFDLFYSLRKEQGILFFDSKLDGDTVDLKLQTDFFQIGQPLISAFTFIEQQLQQIELSNPVKTSPTNKKKMIGKKNKTKKNVVQFELRFAGASVFIENQVFIKEDQVSSLGLKAPTLDVFIRYIHDPQTLKKHGLIIEAQIGETENKVYCSSVPVIIEIVKSLQKYMRQNNTKPIPKKKGESSMDIVQWSEKIDVNFNLKIEPQKLILNCDPLAQIEAEVSLEGIGFHLTTEHDFLAGVLVIDKLGAELKHAFSKVISGSVGLNGFILNTILAPIDGVKEVTTVGSVSDINGYINIQQLQDLDVFKDLWFPHELHNSNLERVVNTSIQVGSKRTFGQIIRDVTTGSPLPWTIIFFIKNIKGTIDLGISTGTFNLDTFKVKSRRSANWDHSLELGSKVLSLSSKGKIEGVLQIQDFMFQTSIGFKLGEEMLDLPLVSVALDVSQLKSNISIDYHPFFIIDGDTISLKIFNEHDIHDKLSSSFKVGSFNIYTTAMMASNFVEIYSIWLRISQNIKISYKQTLNVENATSNLVTDGINNDRFESDTASMTFLKMISKLQTRIFIDVGQLKMLVYPSSLLDSQAMLFKTKSLNASFLQDDYINEVNFKLSDVFVSLSTFKVKLDLSNPVESIKYDDPIFIFPNLHISMKTETHDKLIKYTYLCEFGDKVDIKWKIGSVYFIHQMWISHATTLKERLSFLRIHSTNAEDEENYKESIIESVNIEDKLKNLEMDNEFTYEAIEPAIIETPQLKDLGEATPPLEWFGFHRDKFPILTHKFVILGLKELIKEVEYRYSKVLK